jgi:glycosyltransferase involved in cell wall biosynthesis
MTSVSIVIPVYNEEQAIAGVIQGLRALDADYELIVVDDGSTDRTPQILQELGVSPLRHPYSRGYGAALKTGIRQTSGDVVLFFDADGQHDPSDIACIVEPVGLYDMVVGARVSPAVGTRTRQPGKAVLQLFASYLVGQWIPDLNSGLRAAKRSWLLHFINLLPNGFSLTTTLSVAFYKAGLSIKYVPIQPRRRVGKSTVSLLDGIVTLRLMLRVAMLFSPLRIFGPVSLVLFAIGVPLLVWDVWHINITDVSLLIVLAALMIASLGLIADQLAAMRRGM